VTAPRALAHAGIVAAILAGAWLGGELFRVLAGG
jgi:hypothetical protein